MYVFSAILVSLTECNIDIYRMAKIHCHINECNASVQYFAILHAVNETLKIHSL